LNASTGRVYVSRDVVFDEKLFPFATMHKKRWSTTHIWINLPSLLNHSCGAKLVDDQCANYPKEITNDLVEDALERGSATQKTQAISIPGSVLQMEEPARVARAQESAPGLASTAPTEGG
jgi:hypothetical protein